MKRPLNVKKISPREQRKKLLKIERRYKHDALEDGGYAKHMYKKELHAGNRIEAGFWKDEYANDMWWACHKRQHTINTLAPVDSKMKRPLSPTIRSYIQRLNK